MAAPWRSRRIIEEKNWHIKTIGKKVLKSISLTNSSSIIKVQSNPHHGYSIYLVMMPQKNSQAEMNILTNNVSQWHKFALILSNYTDLHVISPDNIVSKIQSTQKTI